MINFTHIPDKLKYPPNIRGKLSTYHSQVVTYVSSHFKRTYKYRQTVVDVMNTISYMMLSGDAIPPSWSPDSPLDNLAIIEDDICKAVLGEMYLSDKYITWDVEESDVDDRPATFNTLKSADVPTSPVYRAPAVKQVTAATVVNPTPKEDLYIRPPVVPQFDTAKPWRSAFIGGERYTIYSSLPEIPKKQNEISVTTDVNKMTSVDLMKLYPNRHIRTRSPAMYEPIPGIEYDEVLGLILPIAGYTSDQVRENIIKYPHIFKLTRVVDDEIVSLYATIEIDGVLHKVSDVWDTLPEAAVIPRSSEFVKEYVVRRYLLERDVSGIVHKYPMYGSLDPFLTLFTTSDEYIKLGYSNTEDIAKQCVKARVSYKQTRNPVLRRLENA